MKTLKNNVEKLKYQSKILEIVPPPLKETKTNHTGKPGGGQNNVVLRILQRQITARHIKARVYERTSARGKEERKNHTLNVEKNIKNGTILIHGQVSFSLQKKRL